MAIGRWLDFAYEGDYMCGLYIGATYGSLMNVPQQFLSLAQVAEAYHRRQSDVKQMPMPHIKLSPLWPSLPCRSHTKNGSEVCFGIAMKCPLGVGSEPRSTGWASLSLRL